MSSETSRRRWLWLVALVVFAAGAYWLRAMLGGRPTSAAQSAKRPAVPVVVATARAGDLPVYLTGLGSVTAFHTVTVKSRVDGQLVNVAFREGQPVQEGDLLAEVDPRPFQVQLEQAEGQLARDRAQLDDARRTLARYRRLHAEKVVSQQELDDQVAKAGQFEGAIQADQAAIDSAKLQLTYARITAPIGGRTGLRLVDPGNLVHANEDNLPAIMKKLNAGEQLETDAFDRSDQNRIASGTLLTVDNQIDQSTGTVRLKAVFQNEDGALFPNQFVNVHLLLDVKRGTVIVPVAAIQRGPRGTFAYAVKPDHTVEVRTLTVGPAGRTEAAIESGLAAGDVVVIEGVDKLREGTLVQAREAEHNGTHSKPAA